MGLTCSFLQLRLGKVFLAVTLASGVFTSSTGLAQQTESGQGTNHASKPIRFEVISIRKSSAEFPGGYGFTADGVDFTGIWPLLLIGNAYEFRDYTRISGLPTWCVGEKYDIQAKVAEGDIAEWKKRNRAVDAAALRALLEERFQLKAHREITQGKVYELVVAKGGPKMKQVKPPDPIDPDAPPQRGQVGILRTLSMDQLASVLRDRGVSRPVVNKTDLAGLYDAPLRIVPDKDGPPGPPSDDVFIDALRDQLGLDLRSAEGPVETLVVDHVERPTEN